MRFRALPGTFLFTWLVCALAGYAFAGSLGYWAPPDWQRSISESEAKRALQLVFPDVRSDWQSSHGLVEHRSVFRRALIWGETDDGGRYSEQVLKVGWPFTIVRGFVRQKSGVRESSGALGVRTREAVPGVQFWPVQPVWPGVIIDSALLAVILVTLRVLIKKRSISRHSSI